MYRVTEYNGDYQIEDQVFWLEVVESFKAANWIANKLYYYPDDLKKNKLNDYYVLVEKFKPGDELEIGTPVLAYTRNGPLTNEALETFLAMFEQGENGESGEYGGHGEYGGSLV